MKQTIEAGWISDRCSAKSVDDYWIYIRKRIHQIKAMFKVIQPINGTLV